MVNPCDFMNKYVSFASMASGQASSSLISFKSMLKFGSILLVMQEISFLKVHVDEEALDYENLFQRMVWFVGLIDFGHGWLVSISGSLRHGRPF